MRDKVKVAMMNYDNFKGAIYCGEKVQLCEDGGVVHNHCLDEYVMKLATRSV